jgi:uncharacterized protein YutD
MLQLDSRADSSSDITTVDQHQQFVEERRICHNIASRQQPKITEPQCPKSESASDEMADNNSTCHFTKKQVVQNEISKCPFSAASTNTPLGGCPAMGPKHTSITSLCDHLQTVLDFEGHQYQSNASTTASQLQEFIGESCNYNTPSESEQEFSSPEGKSVCPFSKKMNNSSKCPFSATTTNTLMGGCPVMGPKHTSVKSLCDYLENVLEFEPQKDQSNVITTASELQDFITESRNHSIPLETERVLAKNKAPKAQERSDDSEEGGESKSICPFSKKQVVTNNTSKCPFSAPFTDTPTGGCPVMGPKHTSIKSLCDYLENVLDFEPRDQSNVITTASELQDFITESRNHNILLDTEHELVEIKANKTQEAVDASDEGADGKSICPFLDKMNNNSKCSFSLASTNTPKGGCPVMGPKHTSVKSLCDYLENVLEFEPSKNHSNGITNVSQVQDFVDESRNHNIALHRVRDLTENKSPMTQELADASDEEADSKSICPFSEKQVALNTTSRCPYSASSINAPVGGCPVMGPKHTSLKSLRDYLENSLELEYQKSSLANCNYQNAFQPHELADSRAQKAQVIRALEELTDSKSVCPFLQKQAVLISSSKCPAANSSTHTPVGGCPIMGLKHATIKSSHDYLQSALEVDPQNDQSKATTAAEQHHNCIDQST